MELSSCWQKLLQQTDDELRAVDDSANNKDHDSEKHELVRATLENRRDEIAQELRGQQRELQDLRVHLLATIEGVDLRCAVAWPAFFQAVSRVQIHQRLHASAESYSTWHPAATGYVMARDSHAKKELAENTKCDILLPPPVNHEIDGHTDDSASDSAASEDQAASGEDDASDEEGDEENEHEASAPTGEQPKADGGGKAEQRVSDQEGEEEDDSDDKKGEEITPLAVDPAGAPGTKPLTADTLAELTEQQTAAASSESPSAAYQLALKRPRVIKRPVPAAFDASTRNPVFFGYTLEKRADELVEAVGERDALAAKETRIFEQKIQRRKSLLEETLKAERGKLDVVHQREADTKQKRDRYWEKREADMDRAKRQTRNRPKDFDHGLELFIRAERQVRQRPARAVTTFLSGERIRYWSSSSAGLTRLTFGCGLP